MMDRLRKQDVGLLNKFLLLSLLVMALTFGCKSPNNDVNADMIVFPDETENTTRAEITFEEPIYDFGSVVEGDAVRRTFSFTNTGDGDLVIAQVNPECGCTTAKDWPTDAIHPGEKGNITITFDTDKKPGDQEKNITVVANTLPNGTLLTMKGTVIGPQ